MSITKDEENVVTKVTQPPPVSETAKATVGQQLP